MRTSGLAELRKCENKTQRELVGPHVRGYKAQDIVERDFVPQDLVCELFLAQLAGVLVGPRVAGYLMALGDHSLRCALVEDSSTKM